jgi:hypothetical protein
MPVNVIAFKCVLPFVASQEIMILSWASEDKQPEHVFGREIL